MTNSRTKGAGGEREARDLFRRWFPECERSLGQARKKYSLPDLIGSGLEEVFYVEVKRYKKFYPSTIEKLTKKMIKDCDEYNMSKHPDREYIPFLMVFRLDGNPDSWKVRGSVIIFENLAITSYVVANHNLCVYECSWQDFADAMDKTYKVR